MLRAALIAVVPAFSFIVAACSEETETATVPRPVRTATVEKSIGAKPLVLYGAR